MEKESPIFYDQSGKRWKGVKHALFVVLLLLVNLSVWAMKEAHALVPVPSLTSPGLPTVAPEQRSPAEIAYSLDRADLPVVGNGALVRALMVEQMNHRWQGFDPFSGRHLRNFSAEEVALVQGHRYVVERYGSTTGKRLALTFDDGPDPRYTPEILDLLSRERAPATFFVVGSSVVKFPKIAQRIVREGHIVGNHTFTHADFDFSGALRAREEINASERVIRAVTGTYTSYFRLPYGGSDDDSLRDNLRGILQAQQLGYINAAYDMNTNDWQFTYGESIPLNELDGQDHILLLHDGGGDRSATVHYLARLISTAKAQGYRFVTLNELFPTSPSLTGAASPTIADRATLILAQTALVLPSRLMYYLFLLSVSTSLTVAAVYILLALFQSWLQRKPPAAGEHQPLVSVVLPAYNEERVIEKTVQALQRSTYRNIEIIVVDDGSTDRTPAILQTLVSYPDVRTIRQEENSGKAAALNRGVAEARGSIIVTLDADTVFAESTIENLVGRFVDPSVGAVAGVVKVGNPHNLLTAWQALEYITGISVERRAQSLLGAITVVPGACAAWRKSAVREAGGYSSATLAEDCDLTIALQQAGYRVVQDNRAVAYTEAPTTLRALAKQRFRWTFGTLQSLWKHKAMMFQRRHGLLGMVMLPYTALSVVLPLLFLPLIYGLTIKVLLEGQASSVGFYFVIFTISQLVTAFFGVLLAGERPAYLLLVPLYRIVYEPLRAYLIYRSFFTALKGTSVHWQKVPRTGTVPVESRLLKPATTSI